MLLLPTLGFNSTRFSHIKDQADLRTDVFTEDNSPAASSKITSTCEASHKQAEASLRSMGPKEEPMGRRAVRIAALPQTQPKPFTSIEDTVITEKRLRVKQQHAIYVGWIEKTTREQKEALRQYRRVSSRDWRARHTERIKCDESRAKMQAYVYKHRKKIQAGAEYWKRLVGTERPKRKSNKRSRDNHKKTPDNPEKARTLIEQAKLLAGRAQKAAKEIDAVLESGDVKCDELPLAFVGRYVERHGMNIRTGRNPRGSTPPEIFFEIVEAQRSHGDVAALKILTGSNRDIAITLVRT